MPRTAGFFAFCTCLFAYAGSSLGKPTAPAALRWTDETPDAMVARAEERALARTGNESEVVAGLLTIAELESDASFGAATKALNKIAASTMSEELRGEATLLALDSDPRPSEARVQALRKLGVLTDVVVVGPFRDTGGGLDTKEGPEAGSFSDVRARFSWGSIDVGFRSVPRAFASASGHRLDVFISPRKESCTYLASKWIAKKREPVVIRAASAGQIRLTFDGTEIAKSEEVHEHARLDRVAARLEANAGPHLIAAKVCSGALEDDGQVRLRITDAAGKPLEVESSSDLATLATLAKLEKANPTRVRTALEKTLAGSGNIDTELSAVVARTLGGADDLRSPRAPGSLVTVTGRRDISPDQLALAGWIAPSAANQSGWLNQARALATRAQDAKTRAFTDRALLERHIDSRFADWAMAERKAQNLDAQNDVRAKILAAEVDLALNNEALHRKAEQSLSALIQQAPDTVPTTAVSRLAQIGSDPRTRLSAAELLARRTGRMRPLLDASGPRGVNALVDVATKAFDGRLEDFAEATDVVQTLAQHGARAAALELAQKLVVFTPNQPESWSVLAEQIAAGAPEGPDRERAIVSALRRARELAPGEARYRSELTLRTRTPLERADDEKYLVSSETVLSRRQGVPNGTPQVADRELYWLRAVVMHEDKRVSQLIHYAREIVIAPRTEDELFEELPAEGDITEILRARVHRKNGSVAFPSEEHNEGTRPRIRWPELGAGDTVEVAIRTWTAGAVGGRGDAPFYFMDYGGSLSTHPLLYNEVVVESLDRAPIHVDVVSGKPDRREDKTAGNRRIARLIWDKPVTIPDEPLAPALSELVPLVVGSTFKDWSAFRAWYAEAIRGFTEPDAEVRKLAADLTKNKRTRDEKLEALFNFVSDRIRYVNYVSGEFWLPNRPQQVLARREGDCDDKALLLITLLRAIGIQAQEVMVQTRLTGQPSVLRAKNAAVPLFDHGIAFLPGPGGGMYLDATSPQSRLGPLPSMDARGSALRLDAGPAEIVTLPASSPRDHGADIQWTIALRADGSADLIGEETHSGDGAFWLRTQLSESGSGTDYVERNLVGPWFPTVEIPDDITFKGDLPKGKALVRYKAQLTGALRREQSTWVMDLSPSHTLSSQLAPLVRRTLPVVLPPQLAPGHEARSIKLLAPPGFRWTSVNASGVEDGGDFGRAEVKVQEEPGHARAITVRRDVVFDKSTISPDEYGRWRAWIQRVDGLTHRSFRLIEDGRAAPRGRQ